MGARPRLTLRSRSASLLSLLSRTLLSSRPIPSAVCKNASTLSRSAATAAGAGRVPAAAPPPAAAALSGGASTGGMITRRAASSCASSASIPPRASAGR